MYSYCTRGLTSLEKLAIIHIVFLSLLRQTRIMAKHGHVRKSITKRFKFTKNGKILRRVSGQDHYLAKQTSKTRRAKRRWVPVSKSERRQLLRYLYFDRTF